MNICFNIDGWLFGFYKELALSPDPKGIIRRFIFPFNFKAVLMNDILILLGITLLVEHIPAQRFKERVEKLAP